MSLVSRAEAFAVKMHAGMVRKGTDIPYIVHPREAAQIVASITDDEQVIAAALLHDVMEDCGVTEEELSASFGPRVAFLVREETQPQTGDPCRTWDCRKQAAIERLARACRDTKIVALGDKLSNMRANRRDYDAYGEALFLRFHQHDKGRHAWYYRSCAQMLRDELGETPAFAELEQLIAYVFASVPDLHALQAQEGLAV